VWCAGVAAVPIEIAAARAIKRDERNQRIAVNEYLAVPGYATFFVAGDQACILDRESGQPYPMRAQFAVREGDLVAENIQRSTEGQALKSFSWNDVGFIVSLGKGRALAKVFGARFSGPFAWWLYRTAYFIKIVGIKAKVRTAVEWTLNLFLPRDITRA
jgi:NADH dehydrogenase